DGRWRRQLRPPNFSRRDHPCVSGFGSEPVRHEHGIGGKGRDTPPLAPPSWRSSDGRGPGRDEGVDRVGPALQLGNVIHQMPRPWVARARAVQPGLEGESTRRQLTIELLAPTKFSCECMSNGGWGFLRSERWEKKLAGMLFG